MFCINCGTKLPDDAKYCYNCGKKIENITVNKDNIAPEVKKEETKKEEIKVSPSPRTEENGKVTVSAPKPIYPDRVIIAPPETKKEYKEENKEGIDVKRFIPVIGVGLVAVIFMVLLFSGCSMLFGNKNVPDPEYYFKNIAEVKMEKKYGEYRYTITSNYDITDAALDYCDLIAENYYFEETYNDSAEEHGNFTRQYKYKGIRFGFTGSEDISIDFNGPGEESTVAACILKIDIDNYESFNFKEDEQYGENSDNNDEIKEDTETETDEDTAIAAPTPTPTPEPVTEEIILPNLLDYDPTGHFDYSDFHCEPTKAVFHSSNIKDIYVIENYLEQFKKIGYEIKDETVTFDDSYMDAEMHTYTLIHKDTGDEVIVHTSETGYFGSCSIWVDFSYSVDMEGYEFKIDETDESDSDEDSDDFWEDCPSCTFGNCSSCGGDGFLGH